MMRSMFAGVTGLRNHQTRMDVIGNNIANVNTVGFKASRANFSDVFSQTLRGAARATATRAGTNPQQVGLGMGLSTIDVLHTQGNLQLTGRMSDLAIEGNGFFVLSDGARQVYTRAGAFDIDGSGYLSDPGNGLRVMGWMADVNGNFATKDESGLSPIQITLGRAVPAQATENVTFANNLDADLAPGETIIRSMDVYDSLGSRWVLNVEFTKDLVNPNEWTYNITEAGLPAVPPPPSLGNGTLLFNLDGSLDYDPLIPADGMGTLAFSPPGANPVSVDINFRNLTQFAAPTTVKNTYRDGYPSGALDSFTVDTSGVITGVFSNGVTQVLGQVAIATFANPGGLIKTGNNAYAETNNSGARFIGEANTAGAGGFQAATLEMSNVDLAQEFTNMIVTQRGFQANTRTITAADQMLQDLVNLVR